MKKHLIFTSIITAAIFSLCSCGTGSDADVEYTAIGASDATGVGATPLTNGYVYLIEDAIENSGRSADLINLGIPGAETEVIREGVQRLFAKGDNPNLVTIFAGANDITDGDDAASFETNLDQILKKVQDESGAQVYIANIPDLTALPRYEDGSNKNVTRERIDAYNAVIAKLAAQYGAVLVNLSAVAPDDYLVSDDGFHPNDRGHRAIADLFLEQILPRLPAK